MQKRTSNIEALIESLSDLQKEDVVRFLVGFFCSTSETVLKIPHDELVKAMDEHPMFEAGKGYKFT